MASRSEAHETLSLLFARDGVPLAYIYESTKEMIHRMLQRVNGRDPKKMEEFGALGGSSTCKICARTFLAEGGALSYFGVTL